MTDEEDAYKPPKGSVEYVLDSAGYGILGCDCGSRQWIVVAKRGDSGSVRVFCPLCNSYSGEMVPKDERDRIVLREATEEMEEQRKAMDSGDLNSWAFEIPKPKGGNSKN